MTDDVAQHFGVWNGSPGSAFSHGPGISAFRCPQQDHRRCHHQTQKRIGERELAAQHLLNVMPNDLILLDRGYPAWWLFN
jgi:hypothetical protein